MTKQQWFDVLCAKRAARGYTAEENAAYRAQLEIRYMGVSDGAFADKKVSR
jgi:hypothetical protein